VTTTPSIPDLSGEIDRLDALGAVLDGERTREDDDETPDVGVVRSAAGQFRVELDSLRAIVEELGEWGAPTPILSAAYAVSLEHLGLAQMLLDGTDAGPLNPHALLHQVRDAVFHGRRAAEGLQRLENEILAESRRVSRDENRQEFMAG
jgi:hypothetical protein